MLKPLTLSPAAKQSEPHKGQFMGLSLYPSKVGIDNDPLPLAQLHLAPVKRESMSEHVPGVSDDKFDSCVQKVGDQGSADNAYAVCTNALHKHATKEDSKPIALDVSISEADGSSLMPQLLRSGARTLESFRLSTDGKKYKLKFLESDAASDTGSGPTKFKAVLIEEGMGNFADRYYYSKEALEGAGPAFEGQKCYANHPSKSDEQDLPERDVRDIIGHFEDVHPEDDSGRTDLVGTLSVLPDAAFAWVRAQIIHSLEYAKKYPDKFFVGLSINAEGTGREMPIDDVISQAPAAAQDKLEQAKQMGITHVQYVDSLTDAVSCDLVTEPGAGGRIIQAIN